MKPFILATLLLLLSTAEARTYTCTRANGVTYSPVPCEDSHTVIEAPPPSQPASSPYQDMDRRMQVDRDREAAQQRRLQEQYQAKKDAEMEQQRLDLERRKVEALEKQAKNANKRTVCQTTGQSQSFGSTGVYNGTTVCR